MASSPEPARRRSLLRWLPEATLVVVSVALGFAAAQYGEYRNDRNLAERILRSLTAELVENMALLEPTVPFHEVWLGSLQTASPTRDQSALDVWFATRPPFPGEVSTPFVTLRRSAWDAALAAGSLGLLDYDVATALSEIYRAQELVSDNVTRLAAGALSQPATYEPGNGFASTRLLWLTLADIYTAEAMLLALYRQHLPRLQHESAARPRAEVVSGEPERGDGMHVTTSKDGTRIVSATSGTGPPLVLVHGGTADHTRWAPILPALEEHFTVYAMDRRGRGRSGDTEPYAIEREFEDIAALIDSVAQDGEVDVLAHSFGAVCAFEAALLTGRIRRLILYEPPPPGFEAPAEPLARMRRQLDSGDREGLLGTFLVDLAGLTPAELEVMRSVPAWHARVAAAHTILRELDAIATSQPFAAERFSQLQTPTLLLLGGNSSTAYAGTVEQIHSILPDSRIIVLPGQQHIAMNTAPELFVREVLAFLLQ